MGLGRHALTTAGLGLVAALVVGCGSSQGLLSARDHGQLTANLLAVTQAVQKSSCPDTSDALAQLDTTIDGLPAQTNTTLANNLRQGAKVLRADASRQCRHTSPKPPVTTNTTSTSTSTSSTTTTESTTTTQSTTSSTPTPTTPPQTTATAPPTTQTGSGTATSPAPPTTTTNGGAGLTGTTNGSGNG